jgi:hypothetical protein
MSRENWAYIAYALAALTALIWLLTLVMLRRISVAVACIKVTFHCWNGACHSRMQGA